MAIYSPRVFLSKDDRELVGLLAHLLADCDRVHNASNRSPQEAYLADSETLRLIDLLESFVESKKFREGVYFIESLVGDSNASRDSAKEIYLSWRRRHGRTRAVSTAQWENFIARLGIQRESRFSLMYFRTNVLPMDFQYFLRMERKLANSASLSPRVRELVIAFVSAREAAIEKIRSGEMKIEKGSVSGPPKEIIENLKSSEKSLGPDPIPIDRITAVLTIVLDFSTLFTTRDWSVAGFVSTISAAVPQAVLK